MIIEDADALPRISRAREILEAIPLAKIRIYRPIHELAFPDDQFRAAAGAHLLYASR